MKQIKEYLLSKGKKIPSYDFPYACRKDDVIDYLESHGFTRFDYKNSFDTSIDAKIKDRCASGKSTYTIDNYQGSKETHWIRFMHAGKETESNPLLFCYVTDDGSKPPQYSIEYAGYDITNSERLMTWNDVKKTVEKYLDDHETNK